MRDFPETRATLLSRVRHSDSPAWSEFFDLYAPLIYRFARGRGLRNDEAEEVRDQCLELLVRKMPEFDYEPARGRFKSWLFCLVRGRVIDLRRRRPPHTEGRELDAIADDRPDPLWERTWRDEHLRYALDRVRLRVPERDYTAFVMLLEEGLSVDEVATALSLNHNQVYKAKSRVLREVRDLLTSLDG